MSERTYAPNRIRDLRKARGFSLEELGLQMPSELTASTVAKLENRKMALSLDYLTEIAGVLAVSPTELIGGGAADGVRIVPVAGCIAAGNWREAVAMSGESLAIPGHLRGKNLFVLRPEGDSMDLLVKDGGFIVVDPDQRDLIDRKYYAVMNGDGDATFKQFSAQPLALLPCSSNPDHQPLALGSAPFMVIGRVVYVGQEL